MAAEIVFGHADGYGAKRSADEVRIIREMLDEDIARFVTDSNIDAPAANELKSEPPEIQWAVLQRGPVRSATNPSAALVGRIRDAKRMKLAGGASGLPPLAGAGLSPGAASGGAGGGTADERALTDLERFVMENRLDQSAARSLKAEALEVQRTVMAQGPLIKCYNPSGALMGRIRAARLGQRAYMPSAGTPALLDGPSSGGTAAPIDEHMSEEARKAIDKLQGHSGPGAGGGGCGGGAVPPALALENGAPPPSSGGAGAGGVGGGSGGERSGNGAAAVAPSSIEDAQLQEEALKAIKSLNTGGSEQQPVQADVIY